LAVILVFFFVSSTHMADVATRRRRQWRKE
jgi:hypothetical protein